MKKLLVVLAGSALVVLVAAQDFSPASAQASRGVVSALPSFGEPGISPDGSTIAFVSGGDMEMHPRAVDVPVTRPVGESYTGKDSQLDAAVAELLKQIGSAPAKTTAGR